MEKSQVLTGRRRFLRNAAVGIGLCALPGLARAARGRERSLAFESLHTGEKLNVTYWANGWYNPDALWEVDQILRDWRTDETHPIRQELLDLLFDVRRLLRSRAPFEVISAYRSPETNRMLVEQGAGVAKTSLHMKGMAIDVALPDRDLSLLRKAGVVIRRGGVGYYPKPGFVHLDIGKVRSWG